jgi:APA family basic amino acid/polyamine antiporter
MLLYVFLQLVFLKHGTLESLEGVLDVGHVFAENVFGPGGASLINLLIAFFLISSISAMVWVGPRVSMAMGEDYRLWGFLKRKNGHGIPVTAIWFQTVISMVYVITGTFESVLLYCGFILQLSSAMAVAGVFVLRKKGIAPDRFRSPWYPLLPVLFVLLSLWILGYLLADQPRESITGLLILAVGAATYFLSKKRPKQ